MAWLWIKPARILNRENFELPGWKATRWKATSRMGDPGHCKEEYLFKVARYARERGVARAGTIEPAVWMLGSGPLRASLVCEPPNVGLCGRSRPPLTDNRFAGLAQR